MAEEIYVRVEHFREPVQPATDKVLVNIANASLGETFHRALRWRCHYYALTRPADDIAFPADMCRIPSRVEASIAPLRGFRNGGRPTFVNFRRDTAP